MPDRAATTVLSCRHCGAALVEQGGAPGRVVVHGDLAEKPESDLSRHANRYEVACPECGTVNEYDGPWPAAASGGPTAGTQGRAGA